MRRREASFLLSETVPRGWWPLGEGSGCPLHPAHPEQQAGPRTWSPLARLPLSVAACSLESWGRRQRQRMLHIHEGSGRRLIVQLCCHISCSFAASSWAQQSALENAPGAAQQAVPGPVLGAPSKHIGRFLGQASPLPRQSHPSSSHQLEALLGPIALLDRRCPDVLPFCGLHTCHLATRPSPCLYEVTIRKDVPPAHDWPSAQPGEQR